MGSRRQPARRRPFWRGQLSIALSLVALALLAGGVLVFRRGGPRPPSPTTPTAVDGCRATPQFVAGVASSPDVALATDGREKGLVLRSAGGDTYQHPSWDDAGYLGALAYDAQGNVYAAPTPRLSLADNPLAGAATLWRADSASGELRPFTTLPGTASERNPFGTLGLFYACDFDALFAGSVLGSTPNDERGGVLVIRLPDGERTSLLEGTDVMGVLLVRQGLGYVLYAGSARSPEVLALPLDAQGKSAGPVTPLLDLTQAGATPQERARKLRLVGSELIVDLVPFTFSLQANASGTAPLRRATWHWDTAAGAWALQGPAQALQIDPTQQVSSP